MDNFEHIPVLLEEVLEYLQIIPDGIYMDGTLGGAGHSGEIAKRLSPVGRLYGFDRDPEAIAAAGLRLKEYGDRVHIIRDNFKNAVKDLQAEDVTGLDGALLDLGISSHQIDDKDRGFSYMQDAPLDMRMDQSAGMTAADIVNTYPEDELLQIFRDYGEERFAQRIARDIVKKREMQPIRTTFELNDIIYAAIPGKARIPGSHPSKRIYQALRIACNEELTGLAEALRELIDFLNPQGRLCVISFHSLEDAIVKKTFRDIQHPCTCPPSFPVCVCGKQSKGYAVTSKPILPSSGELSRNKRAASAKLRVFEKFSSEKMSGQEIKKR